MARKIAGSRTAATLTLFATSGLLAAGLLAANPADLRAEENAPPLSPQCDVPSSSIAAPAPLPNVTATLETRKTVRVLAIGSSSTFGVGASSGSKNYPAQLTDILEKALKGINVEIINRGVSGEVAKTTAERLRVEVALTHPDLVLWQLGTNDALARVPIDEFEETVTSTIQWLKENKIDVVLVGLQYTARFARDDNYAAVRETLRKIAAQQNILYVRRFEAMRYISSIRNQPAMVSGDDLHLNDLGYHCMAEHIAHAVIANLFVRRFRPPTN
jgi:lysophospholipase L1-like esterase